MNLNQTDSKKKQVFAILGVLLLIVLVVGVSYAMYTFTGTGTKENVITSGAVSIDYAEATRIALTNQYPESDTLGINSTDPNNTMEFTVSANITGTQTINYVIALDAITEGATLKTDKVKVYMTKDNAVVSGFTTGVGNTIASYASKKVTGLVGSYAMLTDSFNATGSHTYKLKAWVSDQYNLPTTYEGSCSNATYTNPSDCIANSGTWTDTNPSIHENETASETFIFKIKVVATDSPIVIE